MCGIAGAVGPVDDRVTCQVRRMLDAMVHRGPDQDGLWQSGEAVLGHRRLSIIDLSDLGRQPMIDPTTGIALTYNGECYNYLELRAELQRRGRTFSSDSDSEVVLAAYAEWGPAATERLRGMFALGVWDPRERTLLLARDRLGIKPLYYYQDDASFLFASELRGLLATTRIPRRIDDSGLRSYVWHGFVPGSGTLVDGIRLLDAGTMLQFQLGGKTSVRRYWQLPRSPAVAQEPADETVARVRAELEETVRLHMVSDVPLGVFLSGGVDSSVLAAMAQRCVDGRVRTFNIRFEEPSFDESPFARKVAEEIGAEHHELTLTEEVFAENLEPALDSLDQPTFDAINSYFVSRAVREAGLTVALAGTGGDELFGGYQSFVDLPRAARWLPGLRSVPRGWKRAAATLASRLIAGKGAGIPPQTRWGKLADLLETEGDPVALYQVAYALFTSATYARLLPGAGSELQWGLTPERLEQWRDATRGCRPLPAVSNLELLSFLGERLLRDTDCASMATSLEVRVPLLDHVFVEAVSAVPDSVRYHPLRRKEMLKHMVADQIDPSIFDRQKAGFELPLGLWCRQRLAPQISAKLLDRELVQAVGLDAGTVARLWAAFEKGGPGLYWSRIWAIYVLLRWCERHGVYA